MMEAVNYSEDGIWRSFWSWGWDRNMGKEDKNTTKNTAEEGALYRC